MATGVKRRQNLLSRPDIMHNHESDIDGMYPIFPIYVLDRLISK